MTDIALRPAAARRGPATGSSGTACCWPGAA